MLLKLWVEFTNYVYDVTGWVLPQTWQEGLANWDNAWNVHAREWVASWSTHHGGRAVPELDITAGPLAIVIIMGIIAIGIERQRQNNQQ